MLSKLKEFFKINRDDDDDDDTVKVKGKVKPKYYGTVTPYPNFNATDDAKVLMSAVKSKGSFLTAQCGVDEDVIISVLVKRTNEQRQKIKAVYQALSGNNLEKDLKAALKSDLEDVTLALLLPPPVFDAFYIRKATKCLGTDEELLVEVLASRTNQEIQDLKQAFREVYGPDLEKVIGDETEGDFHDTLLSLLKGDRDENTEVNLDLARKDAQTLFEKGEEAGDICEATFMEILTKRSGPQLRRTLQIYKDNLGEVSLPKLMTSKLRGDIRDCFIALVKCAWNKAAFFAEKLHDAMKGHGTCEDTLIRILVGRSEIDLKKIVEEYRGMYNRPVQEDIMNDTNGHYQAVLLGLCGPH